MKRYICSECVKGATHERNGKPLQDSKKIVEVSDDIVIMAVADGHGSEKCLRSERGSLIAVNTFCEVMNRYLTSYGQDKKGMETLLTFLNREGDTRFAQDVCEEWQSRVKHSFNKNKILSLIDTNGQVDWKSAYSLYGTTLLGVLITKDFVFSFQIGDGDIVFATESKCYPLVEPEKFLGTETHSLSKVDAWRKSVASIRRKDAEKDLPYMYMLSTDGFANSYANDDVFKDTCREYCEMINQHGFEAVKENLAKWLKETSDGGCGDDVTAAIAYFA